MRQTILAPLAAIALVTALSAPALAAPPPGSTQWVLAVVKATGRGGEEFVSALRIVNPGGVAANVDLTYLAQSPFDASSRAAGDNGSAATKRVTVAPRQTWSTEDVVGTLFSAAPAPFGIAAGGLLVASDAPVEVVSKTFVANAKNGAGTAGTYGFVIPSLGLDQLIGAGDTGIVPFVAASTAGDRGFRSNLILQSASTNALADTVVGVSLVRADGTVVGSRDYALARLASAQQGDVAAALGATADALDLRLAITVRTGGPVAAGLSLIDNAISSIAYVPASILPASGRFGWVLVDDPWELSSGRLDVEGGMPNFLSGLVAVGCGAGTFAYPFLAFGPGSVSDPSAVNTSFTSTATGFTFSGSATGGASWSGALQPWGDGTIRGTLTFTTGASATGCPSATRTLALQASRVQNLPK